MVVLRGLYLNPDIRTLIDTRLTRQIDLEPTGFFKIMRGMMRGMMQKGNVKFLSNLKRVLER